MSLRNLENRLRKGLPSRITTIKRGNTMAEEFGTEKIGALVDSVARITELLIVNLKDGIQISDTMIIPSLIQEAMTAKDSIPGIENEIADLSMEEIGYVVGLLTNRILKVITNIKSK